jgi:molybdate transport system substrate-binding protein
MIAAHSNRTGFVKTLRTIGALLLVLIIAGACQTDVSKIAAPELTVAAAANLTEVFGEIGAKFTQQTGVRLVFSFGATADLAKQIENGAPFDVFAAADSEHVEQLDQKGVLTPGSRALYARGRLVLWIPPGNTLKADRIQAITGKEFERIAIAKPDIAPYGRATVESLQALGIWKDVEPKVVYAQNVSQTKQYAGTGNAEAAFIPLALVKPGEGSCIEVAENLHQPIDQALGIIKDSPRQETARQFVSFLLSGEVQSIFISRGYQKPPSK